MLATKSDTCFNLQAIVMSVCIPQRYACSHTLVHDTIIEDKKNMHATMNRLIHHSHEQVTTQNYT
jgi:hypothetical protein